MAEKKQPIKYTQELLDNCVKKDEAILIGNYDKITRNIDISYTCKCGKADTRCFAILLKMPRL